MMTGGKVNRGSILASGVPVERGRPVHIEREDDWSCTNINNRTGEVVTIETPQDLFRRAHEMMHARHTDKTVLRQYERSGCNDFVYQIAEDCRLHMAHWPWHPSETPPEYRAAAFEEIAQQEKQVAEHLAEHPEDRGTWGDFASRMRICAVQHGLGEEYSVYEANFATRKQAEFAASVMAKLRRGKIAQAACDIQVAFFPPLDLPPGSPGTGSGPRSGLKRPAQNGALLKQPNMDVIELPHTVTIQDAVVGYRKATSGARLHRPSLRKPVLPQRLFIRRSRQEPQGTILVDASGSMGDWSQVKRWCEKAPFGTIAYYAGNGRKGWLYVYARNGKRAAKIVKPGGGGNTVDGPAITWLMSQAKPRLMITDRGFCDVADSQLQVMRLENLERMGEIKVLDYAHDDDDKE